MTLPEEPDFRLSQLVDQELRRPSGSPLPGSWSEP